MSAKVDPEQVLAFKADEAQSFCTERDAIIYALGVGFSTDPLNNEELAYTYELHDDFKVFPTYCTCLHKSDIFKVHINESRKRFSLPAQVYPSSIQWCYFMANKESKSSNPFKPIQSMSLEERSQILLIR